MILPSVRMVSPPLPLLLCRETIQLLVGDGSRKLLDSFIVIEIGSSRSSNRHPFRLVRPEAATLERPR